MDKALKREYCERLERAIDEALGNLGNQAKEALILHLRQGYNIRLGGTNCSSIEDIEQAINEIFGQAGAIIVPWIRKGLENNGDVDDDDKET